MRRTHNHKLLAVALPALLLTLSAGAAFQEKPAQKPAEQSPRKRLVGQEGGEARVRRMVGRVLRHFKDTLESRSSASLREFVDSEKFFDYPRFEQGVEEFFRDLGEVRIHTREVGVQVEGDRAVMIVDVEMIFARSEESGPEQRRSEKITFDFQRTDEGWKITEINPRSFFLP